MPQADKKAPATAVKTEYINDFSGGLNTTISGSLLGEKEAQVADDVSFEQKGTILPRKGRRKRYSVPFADEPVSGLGQLYKQDGTARLIITSGTDMYSDKPNLVTKWASKTDFDGVGTYKTSFVDTSTSETSMCLKRNLTPASTADCESVDLFLALDATLALETSVVKFNSTSLKVTINADKTVGYAKIVPSSLLTTKLYVFSAYIRNGNAASGVRLVALKSDSSVVKGSDYVTATAWTKETLKLNVADMADIKAFALEVKGVATQYGYWDGLVRREITQEDYDNVAYVAPEFTDFEPLNTTFTVDTQTQWAEGVASDAVVGESLSCAIGSNLNNTQDLTQGTLTDIEFINNKMTIDTNMTWEPYAAMTFDALILL